jgi:hypothetical protein
VTKRIPVFIVTGEGDATESATFDQVSLWQAEQARRGVRFAIIFNAHPPTSATSVDTTFISACLCCTGKVTLLTSLTQLLRQNRRSSQASQSARLAGIFIVLANSADIALTIDHLQQPLLEDLIEIQQILHIGRIFERHKEAGGIEAHGLFSSDKEFLPPMGLMLSGSSDWVYRWSSRKVFSRTSVTAILQSYLTSLSPQEAALVKLDSIFRTERCWYRWQGKGDGGGLVQTETNFRLYSYSHLTSSATTMPDVFRALMNA